MIEAARNFGLFALGNVITFTFIALLQSAEGWLFFLFLVAMHAGVVTLIVSKKRFLSLDPTVKHFYDRVYLLLALYIPLLLYKLVGFFFPGMYNGAVASVAMIVIIIVSVACSLLNAMTFYKYLFKGTATHTP